MQKTKRILRIKRILPDEARALLKEASKGDEKSFKNVLAHCEKVREIALRTAKNTKIKSELDTTLIENGSLLHDIGRFECPPGSKDSVRHGIVGAEILRLEGEMCGRQGEFEEYARIAESHLGAGITKEEIKLKNLPLPKEDFIPETNEEKIISIADKLVAGDKEISLTEVLDRWKKELGKEAADRVKKLYNEMM